MSGKRPGPNRAAVEQAEADAADAAAANTSDVEFPEELSDASDVPVDEGADPDDAAIVAADDDILEDSFDAFFGDDETAGNEEFEYLDGYDHGYGVGLATAQANSPANTELDDPTATISYRSGYQNGYLEGYHGLSIDEPPH